MVSSSRIKVSAIIFDQGNTLLLDPFARVMDLQEEHFVEICQNVGLSVNGQIIKDEWTKSNKEIDYPYISHFYQEEPILYHALKNLYVPEAAVPHLAFELLQEYRRGLREVISSDPRTLEVKNTLEELIQMNKKLGIFSNDRTSGLDFVLNSMNVRVSFQYIRTSESIGAEKPDSEVFKHIMRNIKVPPHLVAYVGDDPINDIDAAKKQGLQTIQYLVDVDKYNESWRDYSAMPEHKPDATISRFAEILDVIE